jgi:hypothetical protein
MIALSRLDLGDYGFRYNDVNAAKLQELKLAGLGQ